MHLEGKLHTGYLKIRKVLAELKQKRQEYRRMQEKQGIRRSRSRSPMNTGRGRDSRRGAQTNNTNNANNNERFDEEFYYSSKKYGSGVNCPDTDMRFSELALAVNREGPAVKLEKTETLGKEWGYYKRNIDKARKEKQNEEKRKEEEAKGFRGGDTRFGGD